ncbi:hypothetical protein DPMN_084221 [Dreissena polymorpha]|uniref:Uncharacterized protein n=1 Tax=Dreissena polymorpha TaxID=45954 RepID=A0A9D4BID5_DREPO|nr:hypothetical protein DPMN_084221 [Dreissena polymorpha]
MLDRGRWASNRGCQERGIYSARWTGGGDGAATEAVKREIYATCFGLGQEIGQQQMRSREGYLQSMLEMGRRWVSNRGGQERDICSGCWVGATEAVKRWISVVYDGQGEEMGQQEKR